MERRPTTRLEEAIRRQLIKVCPLTMFPTAQMSSPIPQPQSCHGSLAVTDLFSRHLPKRFRRHSHAQNLTLFCIFSRSTCRKILGWKTTLSFPSDCNIDPVAADLIRNLLCDAKDRLNMSQIKAHPFFNGIDWDNLRSSPPPFVPKLKNTTDCQYFDDFPTNPAPRSKASPPEDAKSPDFLAWVGYTWKRFPDAVMLAKAHITAGLGGLSVSGSKK